jgi:alpha-D-xyloside xylohydrolase
MDFGYDKNVFNIGDQFMFGPSILVNPVTDYKVRKRELYLPEAGGWYEFKTGKYLKGGQTIEAEAPYTDIPVYVKAGAIIPCGPEIQFTTEKTADPIRLFVYTGSDGIFTLYEDENVNYNYEKGKFSTIEFDYNEKEKTLTINDRHGEFDGMLNSRTFEIKWITKNNPSAMELNSKPDEVIKYEGKKIFVKMN